VIGLLKAAGRTLAAPRFCGSFLNDFDGFAGMAADSDEVARAFRDDVARDYEMMSPGFGASLACILFALGRCRSSVLDNV